MKKTAIGALLLMFLTGCWDKLPLRDLHMVDVVGLDQDEKNGDFLLDFVVTTLKKAGQGQGESNSETTELKGASIVEAVGQGGYVDKGPFVGVNTRMYLMSEKFASHEPAKSLAFMLHAPYTAIHSPLVVFEGSVSKLLKNQASSKKQFTDQLNNFITSMEKQGIIPHVSIMHFILSQREPLDDVALPLIKQTDSGLELSGALLFRQGSSTEVKLDQEQVQMLMLLFGKNQVKQKLAGTFTIDSSGRQLITGRLNDIEYGIAVKKGNSKINVYRDSSGLPTISIPVQLKIIAYELGNEGQTLKSDHVKQMEKELSKHLEEKAKATIKSLQKANSDVLGIGKQIKAYHPNIWKSLDWRKDYSQLSIEPVFHVRILNTEAK